MPLDSNSLNKFRVNVAPEVASKWAQRRDIPIAILAWIGLGIVVLWALGWVVRTLLVITVAILLAFALAPAVKFLSRFIPRIIAILIVYLVVLSAISLLLYFVANTAIDQIGTLAKSLTGKGGTNPLTYRGFCSSLRHHTGADKPGCPADSKSSRRFCGQRAPRIDGHR